MSIRTIRSAREQIGLSRIGQRRQVVIPKRIFDSLGLAEGDFMEISVARRGVVMKPKRLVDASDVLTSEEASIVRKGEAQIRRGQSKAWGAVKRGLGG